MAVPRRRPCIPAKSSWRCHPSRQYRCCRRRLSSTKLTHFPSMSWCLRSSTRRLVWATLPVVVACVWSATKLIYFPRAALRTVVVVVHTNRGEAIRTHAKWRSFRGNRGSAAFLSPYRLIEWVSFRTYICQVHAHNAAHTRTHSETLSFHALPFAKRSNATLEISHELVEMVNSFAEQSDIVMEREEGWKYCLACLASSRGMHLRYK